MQVQHVMYYHQKTVYIVSFNLCILSLFLINVLKALQINSDCLKCILGMNLYPANKNSLYYFTHFIPLKQRVAFSGNFI